MASSSIGKAIARWRPRQYVLAGMGVILALSTMTVVISIILQPTSIHFSIADFSLSSTTEEANTQAVVFNLTAYNPSHRAGVVYRSVLVSMQMKGNDMRVRKTSVPAHVTGEKSKICQGRNCNKTMRVRAILDSQFSGFYGSNKSATVNIFAHAMFKVGLASSRVYNIRVSCSPIDFASLGPRQGGTANCAALA